MIQVKYVRFDDPDNTIVVFPEQVQHKDMDVVTLRDEFDRFQRYTAVSAGFISIGISDDDNPNCTCYGRSESLKLEADKGDSRLAMKQILGYEDYQLDD